MSVTEPDNAALTPVPAASNHKYQYGCLMLQVPDYELKGLAYLRNLIEPEQVYHSATPGEFGLEMDSHVTILFGLEDPGSPEFAKQVLFTPPPPVPAVEYAVPLALYSLSVFSAPAYDVLKFDVLSGDLQELNRCYKQAFAHVETHPLYHPHLTVGYLKKGVCTPEWLVDAWLGFLAEPGQNQLVRGNELKYSSPTGDAAFKMLL